MRIVTLSLLLLSILALAGCEGKAEKVKKLQDQYNAEYPAYAKECVDPETAGAARMLTGEKLTAQQMATLEAKKKNETHGASQRPTVLHQSRGKFSPHSSNAVLL